MANLKEIRTRISSVEKTKQVTAAMKMVSAAKLKKAQDAIVQIRPYADKLQEILGNLLNNNFLLENSLKVLINNFSTTSKTFSCSTNDISKSN